MHIAPIVSHFEDIAVASGDQTVQGGNTIKVYGITITDTAGATGAVDLKTATAVPGRDAGTVFGTLSVVANTSFSDEVAFIADAGLVLDVTAGTLQITVKHSQAGG